MLTESLLKRKAFVNELSLQKSNLYQFDSYERMWFASRFAACQKDCSQRVLDLINSKCESFRAEYRQGKLKQPAYDSLEWILSPITTTTLSDSIGTSLVLVVGDMPQTGKGFSAVLKELNTNTSYFVKSYVLTRASVTEMKSPSPCLKANTRSLKTPSGGFSPCVR
ncbi:MAG: hypothetical protein ACTTKO_08405 [Candidatus Limimorpha sp.]